MTHKKVDSNQSWIVHDLRALNYSVLILSSVGNGCPDLLVATQDGTTILLEVKNPQYGKELTPQEREFFDTWPGPKAVITTLAEALAALGVEQGEMV